MHKERGFVLPVVMVVVGLLSALFLFASNEWAKWRQQEQLHIAMTQANYAAESGIAYRLQALQNNCTDYRTQTKQIGEYHVTVHILQHSPTVLRIQAIASLADGIQQTVTVHVEKDTLRVIARLE
jgi:type II secretory pathway pseudopilin PulG